MKLACVENRSQGNAAACRRIVTGRGVNPHAAYPGCTGFVGWEDVCLLPDGRLCCAFSAGYWHASYPTPVDLAPSVAEEHVYTDGVDAPTGGRALWCFSEDGGQSWTMPTELVDSPLDDRHPCILPLGGNRLLLTMFGLADWYGYDAPPPGKAVNSAAFACVSEDGGRSWSAPSPMPTPFRYYTRTRAKAIRTADGRVLLPAYGEDVWGEDEQAAVFESRDLGASWKPLSRLRAPFPLDEPAICEISPGRLLMATRPRGAFFTSSDGGKNWSAPIELGIPMTAPCLLTLSDGTIVCLFGRIGEVNEIQLIYSRDGGETFLAPDAGNGFTLERGAYLYANACELSDGSLYIVYYHPVTDTQTNTCILSLKARLRADDCGIDLLPVNDAPPPDIAALACARLGKE